MIRRCERLAELLEAHGADQHSRDSAELRKLCAERDTLRTANQRLEGEVARLREALEFYADPVRYQGGNQPHESPDKYTKPNAPYLQDITRDYGDIARSALSTANGEVTE